MLSFEEAIKGVWAMFPVGVVFWGADDSLQLRILERDPRSRVLTVVK